MGGERGVPCRIKGEASHWHHSGSYIFELQARHIFNIECRANERLGVYMWHDRVSAHRAFFVRDDKKSIWMKEVLSKHCQICMKIVLHPIGTYGCPLRESLASRDFGGDWFTFHISSPRLGVYPSDDDKFRHL